MQLVGQRFGKLLVVGRGERVVRGKKRLTSYSTYRCQCDCGNTKDILDGSLVSGATQSCGCLHAEKHALRKGAKNGSSPSISETGKWTRVGETAEYLAWQTMKGRCLNTFHKAYARYGGRGITIHPEWIDSFDAFLAHVGPRPSAKHTLDRKENDRGYVPGNVRWATWEQQQNNRRSSKLVTIGEVTLSIAQWARVKEIPEGTVLSRIRMGWDVVRAITQPARGYTRLNP